MKALYKAPGEPAKVIDIENTLKALQEAVGGYIETITIAEDACIIGNEEGRIKGLPFNCNLVGLKLFGPILIVGTKGDEFTDLPVEPEAALKFFFKEPKQ